MRVLVINNHSSHIKDLLLNLKKNNSLSCVTFEKLSQKNYDEHDVIILSGGSSLPVIDHEKEYSTELELIKKTDKPILGICLGFELINYAFGEELKMMNKKEHGTILIERIIDEPIFTGLPNTFQAYEAHRWIVSENKFLIKLAKSKDGIEAIKHPTKKIYGVQFHPEVLFEKSITQKVFNNFLNIAKEEVK